MSGFVMNLPEAVFKYMSTFRPTLRSLLKGFVETLEERLNGPAKESGFQNIDYDEIPGVPIRFILRDRKLLYAYCRHHGMVDIKDGNFADLLHLLENTGWGTIYGSIVTFDMNKPI